MSLALLKNPSKLPFTGTEKEVVKIHTLIQRIHYARKPTASKKDVVNDHLTVLNTSEISI